jgi:hypothetical protein
MNRPPAIPYDLRIGVTGHLNLPDPDGASRAVEALLDQLQRTLESASEFPRGLAGTPATAVRRLVGFLARGLKLVWWSMPLPVKHTPMEQRTPIEWTVISPLARGADRIVARAVLKRPKSRLQVVTPFAVDDYRKDFVDPGDRLEFEELLKLDSAPTQLRGNYGQPQDGDDQASGHVPRNLGYLRVGHRVVDSCEILIALWNGEQAGGRGGTAEIVEYAVDQGRVVLWINSAKPADPVRILIKRVQAKTHSTLPTTPTGIPYHSLPRRAKHLSSNFHQLAAYNRDSAFSPHEFERIADRNLKRLQKDSKAAGLPEALFGKWVEQFLPHYSRADQLAITYQTLYVRTAVWLYVLSAFAVTIAVVQVLFLPLFGELILLEILAIVAVLVLWGIGKNEAWHEKWLHDRHLAERIRISMFRSLFGMLPTAEQPQMELPFYPGPEGWMIYAVEWIEQRGDPALAASQPLGSLKRFILDAWIGDQARFHSINAHRKERAAGWSHDGGLAVLSATLVMATLHWWLGRGHAYREDERDVISLAITALAIVLPAWGAAIHAINILRDRERIGSRSKRMHELLSAIAVRAEHATSLEELQQEISQASKVMAAENHEWWVSLSYRDLVPPA